jgi:hypothetical protein
MGAPRLLGGAGAIGCGTECGAAANVDGGIMADDAAYAPCVEYGGIEYMPALSPDCET